MALTVQTARLSHGTRLRPLLVDQKPLEVNKNGLLCQVETIVGFEKFPAICVWQFDLARQCSVYIERYSPNDDSEIVHVAISLRELGKREPLIMVTNANGRSDSVTLKKGTYQLMASNSYAASISTGIRLLADARKPPLRDGNTGKTAEPLRSEASIVTQTKDAPFRGGSARTVKTSRVSHGTRLNPLLVDNKPLEVDENGLLCQVETIVGFEKFPAICVWQFDLAREWPLLIERYSPNDDSEIVHVAISLRKLGAREPLIMVTNANGRSDSVTLKKGTYQLMASNSYAASIGTGIRLRADAKKLPLWGGNAGKTAEPLWGGSSTITDIEDDPIWGGSAKETMGR